MKDETQEAILYVVKAADGKCRLLEVFASLDDNYSEDEIKRHLLILLEQGDLRYGDEELIADMTLRLREANNRRLPAKESS